MGKLKEEFQKIKDECTKIYSEKGTSAVGEHIIDRQIAEDPMYENVQYKKCIPCDSGRPVLDGICLVCGSNVQPSIGTKVTTIAEIKELLKDLNNRDIAVVEACDENGDVEDLYPMYIDVIEGIELLDGTIVNEVRFCQMPNVPIQLGTGILDENKKEIREGDVINPSKTVWLCPTCGSDNVHTRSWVGLNDNTVHGTTGEDEDWCDDCQGFKDVIEAKLIPRAKLIGFSVTDIEGQNIHPDAKSHSNVFNLEQAKQMLKGNWRLKTIWTDDIECPVMMFEGNVR